MPRPASLRLQIAVLAAALLVQPAVAGAVSFATVVAVGDSLTRAQTNAFPQVTRQLGVPLHNLAVNGATTTSLLADQLDAAVTLEPTFVFIWIGGNDIKNDPLSFAQGNIDPWIENFETAVDALLDSGATVMTANLFDLGLAPWIYQQGLDVTPELLDVIDLLTRNWNDHIEASAATRGVPVVDVYSLFERMAAGELTVAGQEFILAPERGLGMHLFNDTMHPSLVARAIIANEIIATMNLEYGLDVEPISEEQLAEIAGVPIPEPGSGVLLAFGLAALAASRRARRPRTGSG